MKPIKAADLSSRVQRALEMAAAARAAPARSRRERLCTGDGDFAVPKRHSAGGSEMPHITKRWVEPVSAVEEDAFSGELGDERPWCTTVESAVVAKPERVARATIA